jgi:hypothetical protein|tara:strand:- start:570 stop:779 length:210 start_codon:yes stop_codon:yes gene_type:complete
MVTEKPMAQKRDFYSVRRQAVMSIAEWLNGGISRKQIYLKVALKYGYGKSFCDEMIQLHIDIQEETKDE